MREYHQRKHEQEMASKNKTHTHNNCASPKKSITNLLEKMYHDKYIKPIMHQEHTYTWVVSAGLFTKPKGCKVTCEIHTIFSQANTSPTRADGQISRPHSTAEKSCSLDRRRAGT